MEQIKITVNGRELIGEKGETVLNIAARNGIEIPNLCYNGKLKLYGACGLCLVEAENSPTGGAVFRFGLPIGDEHTEEKQA